MKRLLLVVGLTLTALGSIVWLATNVEGVAAEATTLPPVGISELEGGVVLKTDPATAALQERREITGEENPRTPSSTAEEDSRAQARIIGRLLLPEGGPAPDVRLMLHGWPGNSAELAAYGRTVQWEDVEQTSDSEGRFAVEFVPPPPYQLALDAKAEGFVEASWRWAFERPKPGEIVDLGDIVLTRAGTLAGKVVLEKGGNTTPTNLWKVRFTGKRSGGRRAQEDLYAHGRPNARLRFELRGLPPGTGQVVLEHEGHDVKVSRTVEIRAGETTEIELRVSLPEESELPALVVRGGADHNHLEHPEPSFLSLVGEDGRVWPGAKAGFESFRFPGAPVDGVYSLLVEDPRFVRRRIEGVDLEWMLRYAARVTGSSSIALEVVDAGTLEPIEVYALNIEGEGGIRPLKTLDDPIPEGRVYEDIVAGAKALVVVSPGRVEQEIPLDGLRPGELLPLRIELAGGGAIAGRVLTVSGVPVPDAFVEFFDPTDTPSRFPFQPWQEDSERWSFVDERDKRSVRTDGHGAFRFEQVPPGSWAVRALVGPELRSEPVPATVTWAEVHEGLVVEVPECAWLSGRLLAPEGTTFEDFELRARAVLEDGKHSHAVGGRVAQDGAFRIGPLPVGSVEVLVSIRREDVIGVWTGSKQGRSLAELRLEAGENRHDLDLVATLPGTLVMRISVNGEPMRGLTVTASPAEKQPGRERSSTSVGREGEARLLLFPGAWDVLAAPPESVSSHRSNQLWIARFPNSIVVEPRRVSEEVWEIELLEGDVQCLDEVTGQPLAKAQILLVQSSPSGGTSTRGLTTDAKGWLAMRHPPGEIVLERAGTGTLGWFGPDSDSGQRRRVYWSPVGPSPEVVTFPRPTWGRGRLQVVDAETDRPVPVQFVRLDFEVDGRPRQFRTNGGRDGILHVSLPFGPVRLQLFDEAERPLGAAVDFDWSEEEALSKTPLRIRAGSTD